MGRPSAYDEKQDAIILANKAYRDVIARFKEEGYGDDWDPKSITARRQYLRKQGHVSLNSNKSEQTLLTLMGRSRELSKRRDQLVAEIQAVDAELSTLLENIQHYAEAVKEEAEVGVRRLYVLAEEDGSSTTLAVSHGRKPELRSHDAPDGFRPSVDEVISVRRKP